MKRKQVAISTSLILISIVVGLGIAEIGLRILDLGYGNAPYDSHPVLHHVHPTSYYYRSHSPGGEYGGHFVYYDQNGLIAESVKTAPKETDCRIAFLGDSFTEARHVPYEKSFVGLLDSSTDCETRNYGVISYSPIIYYLQWKHVVRKWKPDVVIVQLFSNDMDSDDSYFDEAKFNSDGEPIALPGASGDWIVTYLRKSYVLRLLRRAQLTIEWVVTHWGEQKDVVGDFVEENPDISQVSSDMLKLLNKEVIDSGAKLAIFTVPSKFRLRNQDRTYTEMEFADKWKE